MSHELQKAWAEADAFVTRQVVKEPPELAEAREASRETTAPNIEVSPPQGKFLSLLASIGGARRALEFGALAGYSTTWLARAVGAEGRVVSLELAQQNADVARASVDRAGVGERVTFLVGPARESAQRLVEEGAEPFDFVFIDADKASTPDYLRASLALTGPGAVIVIDNVIRDGSVLRTDGAGPDVEGIRAALEAIGGDDELEATVIQTVGSKGWDGFALIHRAEAS